MTGKKFFAFLLAAALLALAVFGGALPGDLRTGLFPGQRILFFI